MLDVALMGWLDSVTVAVLMPHPARFFVLIAGDTPVGARSCRGPPYLSVLVQPVGEPAG